MTLTLTATVTQTLDVPSVQLIALSTATAPNPVPDNTLIEIWRIHTDDGARYRVLTDQAPRLIGGGWAWLDIHAPYNRPLVYEITAAGAVATTSAVYVVSDRVWLIHSSRADLSMMVETISKIADRKSSSRSAKFTPIGGPSIFLSEGIRDGDSGAVTFRVTDEAALRALFADDSVILINTPGTRGWDICWAWVQPGDVNYSNPADLVPYPYRHVVMPYEVAAEPDVDLEPAWTSGDAEAYWTAQGVNSGQVTARYLNCLNFLTDTRL